MASFNFDKFETEFETRQMMGDVISILRELRGPGANGQPLVAAAEGTPLHALMTKLRVGEETPPENFDFELGNHVTIAQAIQLCTAARANVPENIISPAGRVLYNRSHDRRRPDWVELSRPESADHGLEIQSCHFLNQERTVIDWKLSLPELKRLAHNRLYTPAMMQTSLQLLVDKFCKEHKDLIRDLGANEIANYLLSMEKNRDKSTYRRMELMKLTRMPGQELKAPLAMADKLIDMIYPADRPELIAQRSFAKRTAILSFLPDQLALPLSNRIRKSMEQCAPLSDETILRMAIEAEEASRILLTHPLQYGRQIGAMPAAYHIQFNSIQSGNAPFMNGYGNHMDLHGNPSWLGGQVPPSGHYGLPMGTYGSPYVTYPPVLPLEAASEAMRPQKQKKEKATATPQDPAAHGAAEAIQQFLAAAKEDIHPLAHSTPAQQEARPASGQPTRQLVEVEVHTPLQASNEETIFSSARRNLLADSSHQTDNLMGNLPVGYLSEVSDLILPDEGWTLVQSRSRQKSCTPNTDHPGVQTRSKTQAATAASQLADAIEVSSINISEQLTPEVMTVALKLARDMISGQKSKEDQSYKRGQVQNGRYSSKDRDQSRGRSQETRGRSRERGQSQRDSSKGRYPSRDQSYRGQSHGRYPSQDRKSQARPDSRSYSRSGQDWRSPSRQDRRSYRDQSRDRSQSRYGSQSYRTQSRSPPRREESTKYFSSMSRPSRTPSTGRTSRSNSWDMRKLYSLMKKGENCREDYDPRRQKDCTKCTNPGHHEFECRKYTRYNSQKCHICRKCNHFADSCKEAEKFPPNPGEGFARELEKN